MSFSYSTDQTCKYCTLTWGMTGGIAKVRYCPYCGKAQNYKKKGGNKVESYTVKLIPEDDACEMEIMAESLEDAREIVDKLIKEDLLHNVVVGLDPSVDYICGDIY